MKKINYQFIISILLIFLILYCLYSSRFNIFSSYFEKKEEFSMPTWFQSLTDILKDPTKDIFSTSKSDSGEIDPSLITISTKSKPDFSQIALKTQTNSSKTGLSTIPPPSYPDPVIVPNMDRLSVISTLESSVNTLSNPTLHPLNSHSIESGNIPLPKKAQIPPQPLITKKELKKSEDNNKEEEEKVNENEKLIENIIEKMLKKKPTDIGFLEQFMKDQKKEEEEQEHILPINKNLKKEDSKVINKKNENENENKKESFLSEPSGIHSSLANCKFISSSQCPISYPNDSGAIFPNSYPFMCSSDPNKIIERPKVYGILSRGSLIRVEIAKSGKNMSKDSQLIISCKEIDRYGSLPRLKPIFNREGELKKVQILDSGSGLMSSPEFKFILPINEENEECRLCCS